MPPGGKIRAAVIVAAGVASRLRPYSLEVPKGLMELRKGLTIVEWNVLKLRKVGVESVLVVTRPEYAELFRERLAGRAVVVTVDSASEFGNLYTVYVALRHLSLPFLVVMSDHVFEDEMLARLLSRSSDRAFTICLDTKPPRPDLHEGLQVVLREGVIRRVGKGLSHTFGIDTGLIVFREKAKRYVEEAISAKGPTATIGDALDLAAREGEVDFVDVTGLLWKDIDTPDDLVKARLGLTKIMRRDARRTDDALSAALLRPLTSLLAAAISGRGAATAAYVAVGILPPLLILLALHLLALGTPYALLSVLPAYFALVSADLGEALYALNRREGAFRLAWLSGTVADALLVTNAARPPLPIVALLTPLLSLSNLVREGNGLLVTASGRALRWLLVPLLCGPLGPGAAGALVLLVAQGLLALANIFQSLLSELKAAGPRAVGEPPRPSVDVPHLSVQRCIESLIANTIALVFAVWAINSAGSAFGAARVAGIYGYELRVADLLLLVELSVALYFGYRILASLKSLADMAADSVAVAMRVTRSTAARILADVLYVATGWALASVASPAARGSPVYGELVSPLLALVGLAIMAVSLYDLVRQLQRTFSDVFTSISRRIVELIGGWGQ